MSVVTKGLNWPALIDATQKRKRILVGDLSWEDYQEFLEELGERHLRHTYDQGSLEIMPISREHEVYLWLLGMLVAVLAEELGKPLSAGGQMTLDRKDLERGLQADACFWLANAARVQGTRKLDFTKDPPPDLYLEIEISRTILDRPAVLAALGVPEVWRYDGSSLQFGLLQSDESYQWVDRSATFPEVAPADLLGFLQQIHQSPDHLSIVRAFRTWVREQMPK